MQVANRPLERVIEEACIDLTSEASGLGEVKKDGLNSRVSIKFQQFRVAWDVG